MDVRTLWPQPLSTVHHQPLGYVTDCVRCSGFAGYWGGSSKCRERNTGHTSGDDHRGRLSRHGHGAFRGASEKDAKLAQKLGQLQPFMAVLPQQCMGQLASIGPT
jgi:hypothetical protein